jgi:hypothetical protein
MDGAGLAAYKEMQRACFGYQGTLLKVTTKT